MTKLRRQDYVPAGMFMGLTIGCGIGLHEQYGFFIALGCGLAGMLSGLLLRMHLPIEYCVARKHPMTDGGTCPICGKPQLPTLKL
jgi:hypothetical protein